MEHFTPCIDELDSIKRSLQILNTRLDCSNATLRFEYIYVCGGFLKSFYLYIKATFRCSCPDGIDFLYQLLIFKPSPDGMTITPRNVCAPFDTLSTQR